MCQIKPERWMLCLQVGGLKRGLVLLKGENTDRILRGLITLQRGEMEEIWVEDTTDPGFFFKNQEGKTTPKAGKFPDRPGPHIDNYQTPEVENPYSRYDIVESFGANSLWVAVLLSDPKVPGVLGSS